MNAKVQKLTIELVMKALELWTEANKGSVLPVPEAVAEAMKTSAPTAPPKRRGRPPKIAVAE